MQQQHKPTPRNTPKLTRIINGACNNSRSTARTKENSSSHTPVWISTSLTIYKFHASLVRDSRRALFTSAGCARERSKQTHSNYCAAAFLMGPVHLDAAFTCSSPPSAFSPRSNYRSSCSLPPIPPAHNTIT
jgi:hypothetical protein